MWPQADLGLPYPRWATSKGWEGFLLPPVSVPASNLLTCPPLSPVKQGTRLVITQAAHSWLELKKSSVSMEMVMVVGIGWEVLWPEEGKGCQADKWLLTFAAVADKDPSFHPVDWLGRWHTSTEESMALPKLHKLNEKVHSYVWSAWTEVVQRRLWNFSIIYNFPSTINSSPPVCSSGFFTFFLYGHIVDD